MATRMTQRAKLQYSQYPQSGMPQSTLKNRTLYHGDNLGFLRAMNSNSVHLIATDPPFNKGRDFHATPDSLAAGGSYDDRWSWDRDVHPAWKEQIQDDWPALWFVVDAAETAHGSGMGAFICWLGVRVVEMHRVLRDDGSLFMHCDPTASHYMKLMLDAVFGEENMLNEVIWKCTNSSKDAERKLGAVSNSIFWYSKTGRHTCNTLHAPPDAEYIRKQYRHQDKHGR